MPIPPGATSYTPPATALHANHFQGRVIRHTYRTQGTHDWLLIYTVGGGGIYRFADGGEFRSRPGDVTLYRPRAFQDYQFAPDAGRWDLLWAHFLPRAEWQAWLGWPEIAPGLLRLNLHEPASRRHVVRRMKDVMRFQFGRAPHGLNLAFNAFEEVVLRCDAVNPAPSARQPDARIARALDLLAAELTRPFVEEDLARAVGLSASRFRHLFRAQVGLSARRFQEGQRIRRARELLAFSRQTVAEVAAAVGFQHPFYFTLRFKKHTGESPRDFRRRLQAAA